MKNKTHHYIIILLLFQLVLPSASLFALDVAPRISDREVIEKLTKLESGQEALNQRLTDLRSEMKSGQEALRSEMKSSQEALGKRFDDLGKRLDDSNNTMLVLFGSLITLIVTLFGYIAWDRRTMVKPLLEQINRLEHRVVDVVDDLDLRNVEGSLLARQLKVLRAYARVNPEFAEVMRGLALL